MNSKQGILSSWRTSLIAVVRVAFGVTWAIDAYFKWQPAFQNGFLSYLTDAVDGEPAFLHGWLNTWINFVSLNPHLFALIVATGETAIAIGLIFGLFSNLAYAGGFVLSFVIWSTAESLGGPYATGSTDIGTGIIYMLVFAGLFLLSAGYYYGFDRLLRPRLGKLAFLSAGPIERR